VNIDPVWNTPGGLLKNGDVFDSVRDMGGELLEEDAI
jgi:hypothetical protein